MPDVRELGLVEDVECFRPELEPLALGDGKLLLQAEIDIVNAGIAQRAVSRVAECVRRLADEGGGVEPEVGAALVRGQNGAAERILPWRERTRVGGIG